MHIRARGLFAAIGMAALVPGAAFGADLTVGIASEPSSIDPHYHNLGPNNEIRRHIADSSRQRRRLRRPESSQPQHGTAGCDDSGRASGGGP